MVADLGCGPGYYSITIAELVGEKGKVYAVDSDPKSIKALQAKSERLCLQDIIETHSNSSTDLGFLHDHFIDFVFANGLLCCMVDHIGAVTEIQRILKRDGLAYLSISKIGMKKDPRRVTKQEWSRILGTFSVMEKGESLTNRWATMSLTDIGTMQG